MILYIKNMVCGRCKELVITELDKCGINYDSVEIGEVSICRKLTASQNRRLITSLNKLGFVLLDDQKNDLIEKLKCTITDLETISDEGLSINYSDFISQRVNYSFIYLNTLFSEIKGITIEKYMIKQKIELVKKMLGHDDLNINEVAIKMHYSSLASLSGQFKSITGLTPHHFQQLRYQFQ